MDFLLGFNANFESLIYIKWSFLVIPGNDREKSTTKVGVKKM